MKPIQALKSVFAVITRNLRLFFSGILIGIANIIPGVSGGTMAVILGVYEKLMESIGGFFSNKEKRKEYLLFLVKLGFSALGGIFLFAKFFHFLLTRYPEATHFFFLGLIAASLPFLYSEVREKAFTPSSITAFLAGLGLALFFGFLGEEKSSTGEGMVTILGIAYLKLLVSGFIASGAMVIPGISGSFMLILLGEYSRVLKMVDHAAKETSYWFPLGVFGIGGVLGIVVFARIINFFLKKSYHTTMSFIMGLVVCSLVKVWPGLTLSGLQPLISIGVLVLGFTGALFWGKLKPSKS